MPFTSFPHMYILWFKPCALCDIVSTFFLLLALFSSIHRRVYFFPFFCLGACLPSIFPTLDSLRLAQCALFYLYFFHFGWILSIFHHPIRHSHEEFFFLPSLFNVSSIFSYKILQTNQLNIACSIFHQHKKREQNKNWLRFLNIIIFIHHCYCHHHLK